MKYPPECEAIAEQAPRLVAKRTGLIAETKRRLRLKHYSLRTEQAYLGWIRRFVEAHDRRHPRLMGGKEV